MSSIYTTRRDVKLNVDRMGLLVFALLSGEFNQANGALHRSRVNLISGTQEGHCCLGVGCEVYRRATGVGEWVNTAHGDSARDFQVTPSADSDDLGLDGYSSSTVMPTIVRQWFGISSELQSDMIGWNDEYLNDFREIASRLKKEIADTD